MEAWWTLQRVKIEELCLERYTVPLITTGASRRGLKKLRGRLRNRGRGPGVGEGGKATLN